MSCWQVGKNYVWAMFLQTSQETSVFYSFWVCSETNQTSNSSNLWSCTYAFTETPKDGARASPEQALIPLWDEWWNLPHLAQGGTKERMFCQKVVMESKLQYIWCPEKKRNLQEMTIKGQRISWCVFQHPTSLALPTCRPSLWSLWLRILWPIVLKFHVLNLIGSHSNVDTCLLLTILLHIFTYTYLHI